LQTLTQGFYESNEDKLGRHYRGRYVLIAGGRLARFYDDLESSLERTSVSRTLHAPHDMESDSCEVEGTVIVTGRNVQNTLRACLSSIRNLEFSDRLHVIYVDGGSTDQSVQIAREFDNVEILTEQSGTPAGGRNAGLAKARGEICAFTDADCRVSSQWLERARTRLQDPAIGGVGGPLLPVTLGSLESRLVYYGYSSPLGSAGSIQAAVYENVRDARSLSLGNAIFKRDLLMQLGGFDTSLRFCEDYDLGARIRAAGQRTVYDPAVVVFHEYDKTIHSFMERLFTYGRGRSDAMRRKNTTIFLPSVLGTLGVCLFVVLLLLTAIGWVAVPIPIGIVLLYLTCIAIQSFAIALRHRDPMLLLAAVALVLGHASYALGMCAGLLFPYRSHRRTST
jgi:GT2 family glycosyltransferase